MHEEPTKDRGAPEVNGLSEQDARRLDENLRRELEPHPAAVARIVKNALEGPALEGPVLEGSATSARPHWRLAVVGAFLLLLAIAIPRLWIEPPPVASSPPIAKRHLRISNEGGLVTVTMPAGSALVILPGDSLPGDSL